MIDNNLPSQLGLIAGEGRFPFLVIKEARRRGIGIVAVAIRGETSRDIESYLKEEPLWLDIGQVSRCVDLFKTAGITKAIMAGRVKHSKALSIQKPDALMLKVLYRLSSRSGNAMLDSLAMVFKEEGIEIIDPTVLLGHFMASSGAMTKRAPTKLEREELRFGASKALGLAQLDIGQMVVVKRKAIVVAEAMEGSDAGILRARDITEGPFVVVKVVGPKFDMRFDVPVVGPQTIRSMVDAGAKVLALEVGRVLLLDKVEMLQLAEQHNIAIYGVKCG